MTSNGASKGAATAEAAAAEEERGEGEAGKRAEEMETRL